MIVFTLNMPHRGSWNGRWSGEDKIYARVRPNNTVPKDVVGQDFYYNWDDGWCACVSVTKVDTTPDLRFARVYVSMINAKSNKGNLARLKKCSGFIRSMIAKRVNLRVTPELVFLFDESIEYGSRIDAIIDKITKDMKND